MDGFEGRGLGMGIHNDNFDCYSCGLILKAFKCGLDGFCFVQNRYDNGDVGFHTLSQGISVIGK